MDSAEFTRGIQALTAENGIIQNLQLVVVGAACVMFARLIWTRSGVNRTFAVGISAFSLLVFFREIDIRHLNVPQWAINVTSGPIRDAWFAAVILSTLAYAVFRRADIPVILRAVGRGQLPMLLFAFGFLVVSQSFEFASLVMDTNDFHRYHYLQLGEELAELVGYVFLCWEAFRLMTGQTFGE